MVETTLMLRFVVFKLTFWHFATFWIYTFIWFSSVFCELVNQLSRDCSSLVMDQPEAHKSAMHAKTG